MVNSPIKVAGIGSFGAVVIGLVLALYQVQGWKMPTVLAVLLLSILFGLLALSIGMLCFTAVKAISKFAERRATSAAWISSEVPGLLDYEADGERAGKRFTKELKQFTIDTGKLGQKITPYTKRLRGFAKSGKVIKGTKKQKIANQAAKKIDRSAVYIEKRVELFKGLITDIDRNYDGLVAMQRVDKEDDRVVVERLATTLVSSDSSASASIASMNVYKDTVKTLENLNLSRSVRIASKRLGDGLENMIGLLSKYKDNCHRLYIKTLKLTSTG
jgi:hypothetical protein